MQRISTVFVLTLVVLLSSWTSVTAQEAAIITSDFEKGTERWEKRGARIKTTKKQASKGKKSLLVSGRRESWQGTQLNLTNVISAGKIYTFKASVRLQEGEEPATVKMTMQKGDTKFDAIAAEKVSADAWTMLTGRFVWDGSDPYLLVFFDSPNERTSFYLDDFSLEVMSKPPDQKGSLLKTDFQDGTLQEWLVSDQTVKLFAGAIDSSRFIKVDGRADAAQGPVYRLTSYFYQGRTYRLSIKVALAGGMKNDKLKLTIKHTSPSGEVSATDVAGPVEVDSSGWVVLAGNYEVTAAGGSYEVILTSGRASTSYYMDDFELSVP